MNSEARAPSLDEIRAARKTLGERIRRTPTWLWQGRRIAERTADGTEVYLKLELLQYAGTFKPRGALINMLRLTSEELARGVTAVSAGNHAIAVAFAAQQLGCSAKVVMLASANAARIDACREHGAEVLLIDDVHSAFEKVRELERDEGRVFVHPFEGEGVTLGTATLGLELVEDVPDLEAVIVPIGGGGLCSGVATAVKLALPRAQVFGVEPEGADSMHRSFAAGEPRSIDRVRTIADSLGAPYAQPYSYAVCRRFVDDLVKISDDQMRDAMGLIFEELKMAVEPAAAAATAALVGPLRDRLAGRRVGVIVCGSNIDLESYYRLLR